MKESWVVAMTREEREREREREREWWHWHLGLVGASDR